MKKHLGIIFLTMFCMTVTAAEFPFAKNVEITMLEVWPSNSGTGRYGARVRTEITEAGCRFNAGFQIKDGPGAAAAYSTLLAGVAAGKKIQIYITECGYMPIADRIRLIP